MKRMLVGLALAAAAGEAAGGLWGEGCEYEASREVTADLDGVSAIEVFALAGELEIRGEAGLGEIRVAGRACSDREEVLDQIQLTGRREGDRYLVAAEMPDREAHQEWEDAQALLDLEVRMPAGLALIVSDSSGSIVISDVASLQLSDSSGDVDVENVPGILLVVRDSSGDLRLSRVGAVTIELDSSGEIEISSADSVTIGVDSSGDIRVGDVAGDVTVGVDTSGGICATRVGGSLTVGSDTSGDIVTRDVEGTVSLPPNKR